MTEDPVYFFNPEEQDEENYQYQNENLLFYEHTQNSESIIADLN